MGMDLLLQTTIIDKGKTPDWEAMREVARKLPDAELNMSQEVDLHGDNDEFREHILHQIDEFEAIYDNGTRMAYLMQVRDADVFITGGGSWGDDPCDEWAVLTTLNEFPSVLAAGGFDA